MGHLHAVKVALRVDAPVIKFESVDTQRRAVQHQPGLAESDVLVRHQHCVGAASRRLTVPRSSKVWIVPFQP
jgi:hypothetical protein